MSLCDRLMSSNCKNPTDEGEISPDLCSNEPTYKHIKYLFSACVYIRHYTEVFSPFPQVMHILKDLTGSDSNPATNTKWSYECVRVSSQPASC